MLESSAPSPTLIQSLQRGMHLVAAVTEHGPLTARVLSETTGIVLPTTYHLLRTLVHEGYLRHSAGGQYALGAQLTSVTQLESRARSLRLVREEMSELAQEARVSVSIGVVRGADICYLAVRRASVHASARVLARYDDPRTCDCDWKERSVADGPRNASRLPRYASA